MRKVPLTYQGSSDLLYIGFYIIFHLNKGDPWLKRFENLFSRSVSPSMAQEPHCWM